MKKTFIYTLLCSCTLLFTAMSCPDTDEYLEHHYTVLFENKSGDNIYLVEGYGETPQNYLSPHYAYIDQPDTRIWNINDKEEFYFYISKDYTEYLYLMVFKKSTMDRYTKEELVEQNIYDTLYTFSPAELKKMNFKITYTGE